MLKTALSVIGILALVVLLLVLIGIIWIGIGARRSVGKALALADLKEAAKPLENSDLPEQLKYLEATIERLNRLPADERAYDDEEVFLIFLAAIKERVRGQSSAEAEETLENDYVLLVSWLKHPGLKDSPVQGMDGLYMGLFSYVDIDAIDEILENE